MGYTVYMWLALSTYALLCTTESWVYVETWGWGYMWPMPVLCDQSNFNIALSVVDKFPLTSGSWRHKLMPTIGILICTRTLAH